MEGAEVVPKFSCLNCEDNRWVCEEHPHRNWNGGDGCCGGAGMPCPLCNAGDVPDMEPGTIVFESFFGPLAS